MAVLQRSAVEPLVSTDPERAIDWLLSRATDESRPGHLATIATAWAHHEPNATAEWLGQLPPGRQNDEALVVFARQICHDDPESAAHWAERIANQALEEQTIRHVLSVWKAVDPGSAAQFEAAR